MKNQTNTYLQVVLIKLVRLGIGTKAVKDSGLFDGQSRKVARIVHGAVDWQALKALAEAQGLSAIVLDGLDKCHTDTSSRTDMLPLQLKLEWIGEVLQGEQVYKLQHEVARDMSNLFHKNAIRTYVLKGDVIAECYPKPNHRVSVDVDCFLLPDTGTFDAWSLGNDLIRAKHFDVKTDFYKNSTFNISGVVVENHQYLVPFRGNDKLAEFEKALEAMIQSDKGENRFEGTWLYRPPVMVSALFLIEHAYSHFLHEGLTWRMVLDWVMFRKKHEAEIEWSTLDAFVDEYGFRKFFGAFSRLGDYLAGELKENDLTKNDKKMLEDVWAPLDVHDTVRGLKGKLALAGNTWRARWKYRYFTEMSWLKALWIQTKGVLLEKKPKLE